MTTPKGGATTTTTAKQEVPAYVSAAQQNLLNQSSNVLGPQLQQQQYTQAGLNADQTGAYDLTRALTQNAFQNSGGSAANVLALNRGFDGAAYLAANPDVKAAGVNPLQHYLQFGQNEGRAAPTAASSIAAPNLTNPANAAGVMAGANATQATTRDATAQGYSPSTYSAQNATAKGYDPTQSQAAQVTGAEIQSFLNPYTQSVVDTTLAQMGRSRDTAAASIGAKAAASGAFGGARQAIQSAQLDRSFGEQVASTTATLMSAGYDKATATALANAQMRQQTSQSNQQAANAASQFGANAQNTANLANQSAQNAAGQFNAGAQSTAGQFGAAANNNASLANASASNAASQYNANAQNTRDQFNAGQALTGANNNNANELSRYGLNLNRYSAENSNANALAQLQEAMKTGDQTRQLQAIQALLSQGNAQQQFAQANVSTPLQYLQLLSQMTPQNYGGTNTTTAPNTAQSPLQSLLGAGLFLGGKVL